MRSLLANLKRGLRIARDSARRVARPRSERDFVYFVDYVYRQVLGRAADPNGLKLTATGNVSRAVVGEMVDIIEWPGLDKNELFSIHKVINEPDFLPLHFVRILLQGTKLLRAQRDKLVPTRLGKKMLAPERYGALHALLFHVALWHVNLGYFDSNPIESWPQSDMGVV